jgi:hypothetical protein
VHSTANKERAWSWRQYKIRPKVVDNDSPLWYGRYVSLTLDQTGKSVFVTTFRQDVLTVIHGDTLIGEARCAHEPAQEKGACLHRF